MTKHTTPIGAASAKLSYFRLSLKIITADKIILIIKKINKNQLTSFLSSSNVSRRFSSRIFFCFLRPGLWRSADVFYKQKTFIIKPFEQSKGTNNYFSSQMFLLSIQNDVVRIGQLFQIIRT
jgi:hypothetical protein